VDVVSAKRASTVMESPSAPARRPANEARSLSFGAFGRCTNWALRRFGLRLTRADRVPDWNASFGRIKALGFAPKTVFDIGVGTGTPDLYKAFPDAHYVLIDPALPSLRHMRSIAARLDAKVITVALGDREGKRTFNLRLDDANTSSFYRDTGLARPIESAPVRVRRFDAVIGSFARPALCKIDVQGAELDVLHGMGRRIAEIDALVIETSVLGTFDGGPETAEVVGFLGRHGFALYDILAAVRRPLDGALAQADLLFLRRESPLRADRRWEWPD